MFVRNHKIKLVIFLIVIAVALAGISGCQSGYQPEAGRSEPASKSVSENVYDPDCITEKFWVDVIEEISNEHPRFTRDSDTDWEYQWTDITSHGAYGLTYDDDVNGCFTWVGAQAVIDIDGGDASRAGSLFGFVTGALNDEEQTKSWVWDQIDKCGRHDVSEQRISNDGNVYKLDCYAEGTILSIGLAVKINQ